MSLSSRFARLSKQQPSDGLVQPFGQSQPHPVIRQPFPTHEQSQQPLQQHSHRQQQQPVHQSSLREAQVTFNGVGNSQNGSTRFGINDGHLTDLPLKAPAKHGWEYNPDARNINAHMHHNRQNMNGIGAGSGGKGSKVGGNGPVKGAEKKKSVMERLKLPPGHIEQRLTNLKPVTERLTFLKDSKPSFVLGGKNSTGKYTRRSAEVGKKGVKPKTKGAGKPKWRKTLSPEDLDKDLEMYMAAKSSENAMVIS